MWIFLIYALGLGTVGIALAAAWTDVRGLKIPNLFSLIVLGLFVIAYTIDFFADMGVFKHWLHHLTGMGVMFALTLILYAIGALGAGDSKFASACALWGGLSGLPAFLIYMTALGGLLALFALIIQKTKPFKAPRQGSWIAKLQAGESAIPYGVAIAGGVVAMFWQTGLLPFLL